MMHLVTWCDILLELLYTDSHASSQDTPLYLVEAQSNQTMTAKKKAASKRQAELQTSMETINLNNLHNGTGIGEGDYVFSEETIVGSYSINRGGVIKTCPIKTLKNPLPGMVTVGYDPNPVPFYNDIVFKDQTLEDVLFKLFPASKERIRTHDVIAGRGTLKTLLGLFLYDSRNNNRRVKTFNIKARVLLNTNAVVLEEVDEEAAGAKAFGIPFENEITTSSFRSEFSYYQVHSFQLDNMNFLVRSEVDCFVRNRNGSYESCEIKCRTRPEHQNSAEENNDYHRYVWSQMKLSGTFNAVIGLGIQKIRRDLRVAPTKRNRNEIAQRGGLNSAKAGVIFARFCALMRKIKELALLHCNISLQFNPQNPDEIRVQYVQC